MGCNTSAPSATTVSVAPAGSSSYADGAPAAPVKSASPRVHPAKEISFPQPLAADSLFTSKAVGTPGEADYKVYFYTRHEGMLTKASPWHDIPLRCGSEFNFICEIPKWTRNKYEISTKMPFNPIVQDKNKDGSLRSYKWGDMLFNYGAFPQTWEDPDHTCKHTHCKGDNDPIDVIEIGVRAWSTGSIVPVKVLGIVAMIDDGETDWKVVAINVEDPLAQFLNNIDDVRTMMPGTLDALVTWLRLYKTHKGVINDFAFDGEALDKDFALSIVEETHQHWRQRQGVKAAELANALDFDYTPASVAAQ